MTRIWLVNWHFQSRITLWCRHKSTNFSMGLCWQMPKFIVWRLWSIYFDHHLPLKPSIGKRRKQSCTPNIRSYVFIVYSAQLIRLGRITLSRCVAMLGDVTWQTRLCLAITSTRTHARTHARTRCTTVTQAGTYISSWKSKLKMLIAKS